MANWQDKAEFINQNSRIALARLTSPQNAFLGQTPTMVTYYHINTELSSRDKGLQNVERLTGSDAGTVYNKITDVPLYGIDMMDMQIDEEEEGLETTIDGNFILPPHVFHPMPDDYFVIDHLNQPFSFRVVSVSYDTPNGNGFFRCEFQLWSSNAYNIEWIEQSTVKTYKCIFDNIGTARKVVVADEEFDVLDDIDKIRRNLRKAYMEKFYDKGYNALMYMRFSNDKYLYDPILNSFCNREKVFEIDPYGTSDCYLFYEEKRNFHDTEYENSIFDRLTHKDLDDLDDVGKYFDAESCKVDVSIFDYNADHRVKYIMCYPDQTGPFGNLLGEYIPVNFISALELRNSGDLLTDPYEKFIFKYMTCVTPAELKNSLDLVRKRRIKYDMHTYLFIPMIMYCLKQCYNSIIFDSNIMDEAILDEYTIKKGGKI